VYRARVPQVFSLVFVEGRQTRRRGAEVPDEVGGGALTLNTRFVANLNTLADDVSGNCWQEGCGAGWGSFGSPRFDPGFS
jgi:hypothetical protein